MRISSIAAATKIALVVMWNPARAKPMMRGCLMLLKYTPIDRTDAMNPRIIAPLPTAPRKSYMKNVLSSPAVPVPRAGAGEKG